jgi:hypothetical protein
MSRLTLLNTSNAQKALTAALAEIRAVALEDLTREREVRSRNLCRTAGALGA